MSSKKNILKDFKVTVQPDIGGYFDSFVLAEYSVDSHEKVMPLNSVKNPGCQDGVCSGLLKGYKCCHYNRETLLRGEEL
jgi:hypothetical protein